MRRLTFSLDSLIALREGAAMREGDPSAVVALAELAGVSSMRLGIAEELRPVTEIDVMELRRTARSLELRMPASQTLLKVALGARPDRVILAGTGWNDQGASPLDPRSNGAALGSIVRSLVEAQIPVGALIAPELDAVKAAHGLGVTSVEFYTGSIVDLPAAERRVELERLGDASRIASKLHLDGIGVGGGLDFRSVPEVLEAAPAADRVVAGRSLIGRAVLVGIDQTIRDFRQLVG